MAKNKCIAHISESAVSRQTLLRNQETLLCLYSFFSHLKIHPKGIILNMEKALRQKKSVNLKPVFVPY